MVLGLAKKFFGADQHEKAEAHVEQVFAEYDVDNSGELSYEEARDFLKGIMAYLDANGNLTDAARAEFMQLFAESETAEIEETPIEEPAEQSAEQPAEQPVEAAEPVVTVVSEPSNNAQNDIEDNIIPVSKKVIFASQN